jgi:hypothetical protein
MAMALSAGADRASSEESVSSAPVGLFEIAEVAESPNPHLLHRAYPDRSVRTER